MDKVDAGVNTRVGHLEPVDTVLLLEVEVVTRLNVVEDGLPALIVVYKVTKARGVDNRKLETDTVLLNVCKMCELLSSLNCILRLEDGLGDAGACSCGKAGGHCRTQAHSGGTHDAREDILPPSRNPQLTGADALNVDGPATVASRFGDDLRLVELGLEEGVDEGRLAETRLACAKVSTGLRLKLGGTVVVPRFQYFGPLHALGLVLVWCASRPRWSTYQLPWQQTGSRACSVSVLYMDTSEAEGHVSVVGKGTTRRVIGQLPL